MSHPFAFVGISPGRAISQIQKEHLAAGPHSFGPVLLPDDATSFSLTFPVTDEHVGWSLDTYVSIDGEAASEVYAGGCARAYRGARPSRRVRPSGILRRLPPGRNRVLRAILTLSKPLVLQGDLRVYTDRILLDRTPADHHSVGFDNVIEDSDINVTSHTSPPFTISSLANRACMLQAVFFDNTVSAFNSIAVGGVSGEAITGADATNASIPIRIVCFGVTAPPSGSQTGTLSWTTASSITLALMTATGVNQGGVNTGTFNNGNARAQNSVSTSSLTITSANGDLTSTAAYASGAPPSTNQTGPKWSDGNAAGDVGAGTGNTTHTWNGGFSNYCIAGANFVQSVAAAAFVPYNPWEQRAPILAQ